MPDQVRINQDIYDTKLKEEMERDHLGKVALMHDGEVVHILDSMDDAYEVGTRLYGLGNFSIVKIGQKPVRLSRRAAGLVASA